jgi:hypothetical protein
MSAHEKAIEAALKDRGYLFLTSGWPDRIVFRLQNGKIADLFFVEIKRGRDTVKDNQSLMHLFLEAAIGIPTYVIWSTNQVDKVLAERAARHPD